MSINIQARTSHEQIYLCHRCASFTREWKEDSLGVERVEIDRNFSIFQEDCRICCVFNHIHPPESAPLQQVFRLNIERVDYYRTLILHNRRKLGIFREQGYILGRYVIEERAVSRPTSAWNLPAQYVNLTALRSWIRICHRLHNHKLSPQEIDGMRLTHVKTRDIVEAKIAIRATCRSILRLKCQIQSTRGS